MKINKYYVIGFIAIVILIWLLFRNNKEGKPLNFFDWWNPANW